MKKYLIFLTLLVHSICDSQTLSYSTRSVPICDTSVILNRKFTIIEYVDKKYLNIQKEIQKNLKNESYFFLKENEYITINERNDSIANKANIFIEDDEWLVSIELNSSYENFSLTPIYYKDGIVVFKVSCCVRKRFGKNKGCLMNYCSFLLAKYD